jgi:acetyl-CoA carboxylase biotin carboxyl carrier protein
MSDKKPQGIDPELVRELASILSDSGLSEIEVEHGELRLRLARTMTAVHAPTHMVQVPQAVAAAPVAVAPVATTPSSVAPAPAAEAKSHPGAVTSPMVGTAYLSPEPEAPPFVRIGDTVTQGQTIMVVEAMKTFNPIPAPRAGKVTAILVSDAQPVEFGEPLAIIE